MRPYLISFAASLLVCVGCGALAAQSSRARNEGPRALLDLANRERDANGLPLLQWDDALAHAALQHAELMAERQSISHQFANEPDLAERVGAEGVRFSAVAENVALSGSVASTHSGWMHSAGHRANILDANMTALGVAIVTVNGRMFAVEDFARTVANVSLVEQERRVGKMVGARGLKITPYAEEARRICDGGRAAHGERKPLFTMRYTTQNLGLLPEQLISAAESGRYRDASVGACIGERTGSFSSYHLVVLLF